MMEDSIYIRLLDDLAHVHHGDLFGHLGDDTQVVGDIHLDSSRFRLT